MLDHVFCFPDEATAKASLPEYVSADGEGNSLWNTSVGIYGQTVTITPAVWDHTDPMAPVLVTPAVTAPGYWCSISLTEYKPEFAEIANNALRFAFDCDTQQFVHLAPNIDQNLLQNATIEPVFAGHHYPFGG